MSQSTGLPFFQERTSLALTREQMVLISWIEFYEKIYALDDVKRPPDDVIASDGRLDYWVKRVKRDNLNDLIEFYNAQDRIRREAKAANRKGSAGKPSRIVG